MKKILYLLVLIAASLGVVSCEENAYLKDVYIKPVADFNVEKDTYEVFESVKLVNAGEAQNYVVYTGDEGHIYGESKSTGFATASNGEFSYSFQDAGEYTIVWVASSMNLNGEVELDTKSKVINVVSTNGGLDNFRILRLAKIAGITPTTYYNAEGEFITENSLICPVMFDAWNDKSMGSIKALNNVEFQLSSSTSVMNWIDPTTGEKKALPESSIKAADRILFAQDGKIKTQKFVVTTPSGSETEYFVTPVMIPTFTKFSINGVSADCDRNVAYYDRFDVEVTLASDVDLATLKPEFEVMGNDEDLIDGTNVKVSVNDVQQVSGTSVVDFSSKEVVYKIDYTVLGAENPDMSWSSLVTVKINQ